jgi:hypothetical protein
MLGQPSLSQLQAAMLRAVCSAGISTQHCSALCSSAKTLGTWQHLEPDHSYDGMDDGQNQHPSSHAQHARSHTLRHCLLASCSLGVYKTLAPAHA